MDLEDENGGLSFKPARNELLPAHFAREVNIRVEKCERLLKATAALLILRGRTGNPLGALPKRVTAGHIGNVAILVERREARCNDFPVWHNAFCLLNHTARAFPRLPARLWDVWNRTAHFSIVTPRAFAAALGISG